MNITRRSRDIYMTPDGDLFMDKNQAGDLYRAGPKKNELLESLVAKRVLSSRGDWSFAPHCGAQLVDFVGMPNTRETAALIQVRLMQVLTEDNLLTTGSLELDVAPINENAIFILMAMAGIEDNVPNIIQGYGYDLRDNKMVPRVINI